MEITWGCFGIVHILTLIAGVGIIAGLYFLLRHRSRTVQKAVLGVLSLSGICAIIFNLVTWGSPVEYLPLHLCSLNALVLPFAVLTGSKRLNNLLLLWSLGALVALIVNTAQANYNLLSWTFVIYYFPHLIQAGTPTLMFALGLAKKDVRCIGSTLGITGCVYVLVHLANTLLNNWLSSTGSDIRVNYMYSVGPENPVLALFYQLIPHSFWYMLLILPIILVYLTLCYLPQLLKLRAGRKQASA